MFQGPDVKSSNFIWGESLGKISPQQWTQRDVSGASTAISWLRYISLQVDLFNGLNNDILAREGLVALDMKHSVSPGPVSVTPVGTPGPITHIKQDMMYPSSMSSPAPPNSRQVRGGEVARGDDCLYYQWYQEACLGVSRWSEKQKNVVRPSQSSLILAILSCPCIL